MPFDALECCLSTKQSSVTNPGNRPLLAHEWTRGESGAVRQTRLIHAAENMSRDYTDQSCSSAFNRIGPWHRSRPRYALLGQALSMHPIGMVDQRSGMPASKSPRPCVWLEPRLGTCVAEFFFFLRHSKHQDSHAIPPELFVCIFTIIADNCISFVMLVDQNQIFHALCRFRLDAWSNSSSFPATA